MDDHFLEIIFNLFQKSFYKSTFTNYLFESHGIIPLNSKSKIKISFSIIILNCMELFLINSKEYEADLTFD